jgi:hypothetical protein
MSCGLDRSSHRTAPVQWLAQPSLRPRGVDPAPGCASGEPFVVQHIHDPRRRWGSTPYGTAIADNAFVFHQTEMTGRLWLLTPGAARTTN